MSGKMRFIDSRSEGTEIKLFEVIDSDYPFLFGREPREDACYLGSGPMKMDAPGMA